MRSKKHFSHFPTSPRLLCLLFTTLLLLFSASDDALGEDVSLTTPPNTSEPTIVSIGLWIKQIATIDEAFGTFDLEGFLDVSWFDPRLALDNARTDDQPKVYLEQEAEEFLQEIWWPDLEIVNREGRREKENKELLIYPNGRVEYKEPFRATVASHYDMAKFPFDTQILRVEIESFPWSSRVMQLKVNQSFVGFSDRFTVPGWHVLNVKESVREAQVPRSSERVSGLVAEIVVKRDPGFFIWKVIVPLMVIVLLVGVTVWIPCNLIKDRIGATMTGVLTAAAYGFTISRYLPQHVYNTFLDSISFLSLIFPALLMVAHIVIYRLDGNGSTAIASRLDQMLRWFYPVSFLLVLVVLVFTYGLLENPVGF